MESFYLTLFVCYMAYAYNRKCVALSMPGLIEEGLETSHAGLILSCQNIAMSFSKFTFGILVDRLNPLKLFAIGLFVTGTLTLLFSSSSSVLTFCLFWFMNGLGQGCGWPTLSKILRQRADPTKFGTLWSFLSSSNNISGMVSPFLTAYLVLNYGSRAGIRSAGVYSIVLSIILMFLIKNYFDSEAKTTNNTDKSTKHAGADSSVTLSTLLKDPFLWLVTVTFMVVFCTKSTLVDWGSLYMKQDQGLSLAQGSAFTSTVEVGGFVGRLLAGYLTDIFVKRYSSDPVNKTPAYQVRMTVAVAFLVGCIFSLHLFRTTLDDDTSLVWITIIGFLSGASLYGMIAICGIAASESAPSHLSGSAYAIAALGGNIGSTLSGLPLCYLATHYSWSNVFLLLEITLGVVSVLVIFFKNTRATVSMTKKED